MRRRAPSGHDALVAQAPEHLVRLQCGIRVAERRQFDGCRVDTIRDADRPRIYALHHDRLVSDPLDALGSGEAVGLEEDPMEPLADLAVGDALDPAVQHLGDGANSGLGVRVVDASDEKSALGL